MFLARFKLHLRPQDADFRDHQQVPPLPPNKTIVQVFGDFLRYLYQCARTYIQDTHAANSPLWELLEDDIEFVLTHSNSWEEAQREVLRRAAIYGGLIPDTPDGHSRIKCVSEGEASLHYCISNDCFSDIIKVRRHYVVPPLALKLSIEWGRRHCHRCWRWDH